MDSLIHRLIRLAPNQQDELNRTDTYESWKDLVITVVTHLYATSAKQMSEADISAILDEIQQSTKCRRISTSHIFRRYEEECIRRDVLSIPWPTISSHSHASNTIS